MDLIHLDLRGTYIKTSRETLIRGSDYFRAQLSGDFLTKGDSRENAIFIDRSPKAFQHVLNLLANEGYDFPEKYLCELDFYGIGYNVGVDVEKVPTAEWKVDTANNENNYWATVIQVAAKPDTGSVKMIEKLSSLSKNQWKTTRMYDMIHKMWIEVPIENRHFGWKKIELSYHGNIFFTQYITSTVFDELLSRKTYIEKIDEDTRVKSVKIPINLPFPIPIANLISEIIIDFDCEVEGTLYAEVEVLNNDLRVKFSEKRNSDYDIFPKFVHNQQIKDIHQKINIRDNCRDCVEIRFAVLNKSLTKSLSIKKAYTRLNNAPQYDFHFPLVEYIRSIKEDTVQCIYVHKFDKPFAFQRFHMTEFFIELFEEPPKDEEWNLFVEFTGSNILKMRDGLLGIAYVN